MGRGLLCHLTRRKNVRTRYGPAPVSKTLNIGLCLFDVIPTHMWTLKFFFSDDAVMSISSRFSSSAVLASVSERVGAAGLGASIRSSKAALCCMGWIATGE